MTCEQIMWWVEQCAKALHTARHPGGLNMMNCDEVSLAFPSQPMFHEFLAVAKACGMENFNNTRSLVLCNYDGQRSAYVAEYSFLTLPTMTVDGRQWRIELVLADRSPLHLRFFYHEQMPKIVHVSYKCHSGAEWLHANKEMDRLGYAEKMVCASDYGLFSYRRSPGRPEWPLGQVYLKPRLPWATVKLMPPLAVAPENP